MADLVLRPVSLAAIGDESYEVTLETEAGARETYVFAVEEGEGTPVVLRQEEFIERVGFDQGPARALFDLLQRLHAARRAGMRFGRG